MIVVLLLILVNIFILKNTKQPSKLVEVKEKYEILRDHLHENEIEKFNSLRRCVPITAIQKMNGNSVGYNTNKGENITICLDGEVNEIFHVLIHELAHNTVKEYAHSDSFWENYTDLRDLCIHLGIYEKIPERTEFCGKHVQDK
jgi:hypothetical protein